MSEAERRKKDYERVKEWKLRNGWSVRQQRKRWWARRKAERAAARVQTIKKEEVREKVVRPVRVVQETRYVPIEEALDCRTSVEKASDEAYQRSALKAQGAEKEEDPPERVVTKTEVELQLERQLAALVKRKSGVEFAEDELLNERMN